MNTPSVPRVVAAAVLLTSVAIANACSDGGTDTSVAETMTECEIAIVGGGAGGLHTAFRLGPALGASVCLFEKENHLGGRIYDVSLDETDPDAPRIGTGARRIMETQQVLFSLAAELGLTLEAPPNEADLINARGRFAFTKDDLHGAAYPTIPADPDPNLDLETWLYDQLRFGPMRADATRAPDFRSYIRRAVGEEPYEFLHDMSRFRADFEAPLDARGYLDYLDEEWDVCCQPSYPVGGMSMFIREMERRAIESGVRIFKGEAVTDLEKSGAEYALATTKRTVRAKKLVLAIPPIAFEGMTGDLAKSIKVLPEFKELIGIRVVTITQWWPTAWWKDIVNPALTADNHVWRAWTTEHCLNFMEIPLNPDAVAQKVTRTVYDDDLRCVAFWEELAKDSMAKVEEELKRGLEHMFNENYVSLPANVIIPAPLKTHVQIWPAAWHWLRAGATHTNAEIAEWALEPLPGDEVALVGEAYYPQRSGWSDAAYKSSIKLLNGKYGMSLQGLRRSALRIADREATIKRRWDGGRR